VKKSNLPLTDPLRPADCLTEQEAEECLTKICNTQLTDTLKNLLNEASNTEQTEAKMIALYTQLQIVTNESIGKLNPEIRESRNQSHMRLI